jgi:hypothetical protein
MKKSSTHSNVFSSYESEADCAHDRELCRNIRRTLRTQYSDQRPKSSTVRNLIAFAKVLRVAQSSSLGTVELVIN